MRKLPNIHPNGFWVYLLKTFWNGARIRLHYWPRGQKRLDTPHNHRTWFVSIPLWGLFTEKQYVEVEGDNFNVVKCHSTTSGSSVLTTPVGKGNVCQTKSKIRIPLLPYYCGMESIHSFTPIGKGPAVTLVLFGPPKKTPKAWI